MRVDPKGSIGGYSVLLVRQALRKLRQVDQWNSVELEGAGGLPAGGGQELVRTLAADGLIREVRSGLWTVSESGMRFTAATAAKRLTRAAAERILAEFLERVSRVNEDPYFLGQVTRVVLFGSMLNPDIDRPSDVDLAIEVMPKIADWDLHMQKNYKRAEELMALGYRFRHTVEYATCWYGEVFRFLKGRSRAISLADYRVEKCLVLAAPHRMLLGDDELAPIDEPELPKTGRRPNPSGCSFNARRTVTGNHDGGR